MCHYCGQMLAHTAQSSTSPAVQDLLLPHRSIIKHNHLQCFSTHTHDRVTHHI